MRNFNYSVIITTEDNRFTYESNDVREAIRATFECADDSSEVCICNGYTGEVLFHNGEEPYCTDEMGLIMLGFLMEESWGEQEEAEEEEDEDEPVEVVEVPGMGLVSAFLAEVMALPGRDLDVSPCLLPISKGLPS